MEVKREVFFGDNVHLSLKKGVDTLSDSVKTTMGPKGRLVLIQRPGKHPIVTKDGVTVAQSINLVNEVENLGAKVIKEAASRTAEEAGDGTTTSTVLAQVIYTEGLKMKAAGYQPDLLKQGIEMGLSIVKDDLLNQKKDIKNNEELQQVAMISANGEKEVSDLIVEAIEASGPDGNIIVEEAKGFKSNLTIVDGFRLERGYLSPYFVTDKNKMTCEFEKPLILLADREFASIKDLMRPLEMGLESSRPILVIGNEIEGEALQGLVLNKVKGSLRVCAIKSPGFSSMRREMLEDLQTVIGGTVIDSSFEMSKFQMEDFGQCKKTIINRTNSMVISHDNSENSRISDRVDSLKSRLEQPGLEAVEKELLTSRIQQLAGGISILRIGAATESELIERYDRVDDALHATKAAIQEGILPGGGVALVRTRSKILDAMKKQTNQDIRAGLDIMFRAVVEPFKQIIKNGVHSPDAILVKVSNSNTSLGYDAREDNFGDMYEIGIVDPHKVVRCAIENAVSAATMLLNVECCMIEVEKQQNDSDNYL